MQTRSSEKAYCRLFSLSLCPSHDRWSNVCRKESRHQWVFNYFLFFFLQPTFDLHQCFLLHASTFDCDDFWGADCWVEVVIATLHPKRPCK
jgi:hypothetical protein